MNSVDLQLSRLKGPFLWAAAKGGRAEEVQSLLVSHGADVNWCQPPDEHQQNIDGSEYTGDSVLLTAVRNGHLDVVEVLLAHGADIDCRCTLKGDTVLHISAELGDENLCNLILESRRDMAFCMNNFGETPISIALERGFEGLSEHLKYAPLQDSTTSLDNVHQNMHSSTPKNYLSLSPLITSIDNQQNKGAPRLARLHRSHDQRRQRSTKHDTTTLSSTEEGIITSTRTHSLCKPLSSQLSFDDEDISQYKNSDSDNESNSTDNLPNFDRLKRCASSFSSINLGQEYAEFFAEVDVNKLSKFEAASQQVNVENQDDVTAQLTGLWFMVKHFRQEKRQMEARAGALEAQYNTLKSQVESIKKCNFEYKSKLEESKHELEGLQGKKIHEKNVKELESLEAKVRSSLSLIIDAKEQALANILREEKDERVCVVCQEERKSVLLMPCRHLCCCRTCSRRPELTRCPLCRNNITQKIDVYS